MKINHQLVVYTVFIFTFMNTISVQYKTLTLIQKNKLVCRRKYFGDVKTKYLNRNEAAVILPNGVVH